MCKCSTNQGNKSIITVCDAPPDESDTVCPGGIFNYQVGDLCELYQDGVWNKLTVTRSIQGQVVEAEFDDSRLGGLSYGWGCQSRMTDGFYAVFRHYSSLNTMDPPCGHESK